MAQTAAAATILKPSTVFGTAANSAIALGLIGCGGRGSWIAELFLKTGKYRIVACADYFPDRMEKIAEKCQIDAARRHATLSGYRRLLEGKPDAVVIETPPVFHPEQAAAAVDAGCHVFLAKPIAIDVPGCQSVAESGRRATQNKRVMLVDFQTRADPIYRQAVARVHRGEIGQLVYAEANYPWSGGGPGAPRRPPRRGCATGTNGWISAAT